MHKGYKRVRDIVKICPLPLLAIKDQTMINYANSLLPRSVGIEIEAPPRPLDVEGFSSIEYIKTRAIEELSKYDILSFDITAIESRFRIPPGIKGLVCLYHLSLFLKKYFLINNKSGIHYHIDYYKEWKYGSKLSYKRIDSNEPVIERNSRWMINALHHWGYKGTYNKMQLSFSKQAIRLHNDYKSIEFRIGEMTFDYELLVKRILNCQNIVNRFYKLEKKYPGSKGKKTYNNYTSPTF